MLNEDEEKQFRILLEQWEAGHLSPDKIHFPGDGLPSVKEESLFWQCVDHVGTQDFWLGKTRGGRIVRACLSLATVWGTVDVGVRAGSWAASNVVYPIVEDIPVVAGHLNRFLADLDAKLFPISDKDKFLAFAKSLDQPHGDLMIPASSGILAPEIIDHGLPPTLLWAGYNNSQFASLETSRRIHDVNAGIRSRNDRNINQQGAAWLRRQQEGLG